MNAHRHVYDGIITTTQLLQFYRWHLCIFSLDQGSVYWAILTNRIWQHWCWNSFQAQVLQSGHSHFSLGTLTGCSYGKLSQHAMRRWSHAESIVPRQRSITPTGHVYQPSWTFNLAEPSTYDYNNTKDCKQELPSWAQSTQRVMRDIHKLF